MKPGSEPPANIVIEDDGSMWFEITDYHGDNSKFIHLGIAPVPQNKFRWIVYHICMGMISQYPVIDIIRFLLK